MNSRAAVLCVAVLVVFAPPLLFPDRLPGILVSLACVAVALSFSYEFYGTQHRTPADFPIAGLCIMAAVGTVISPAPDVTLSKATGMVFGVASARVVLILAQSEATAWSAGVVYVAFGTLTTLVGIAATAWGTSAGSLVPLTSRIRGVAEALPQLVGVNPNAEAAAVLCVFPLVTAMCLSPSATSRLKRSAISALWLALLGVLVLTQSRSGLVAAGLTCAALLALRTRRFVVLAGTALLLIVVALAVTEKTMDSTAMDQKVERGDQSIEGAVRSAAQSIDARNNIWIRALWAVEDFPLTGVGFGAFRRVVPVLYPLYDQPVDVDVAHAHNQLLQVALDVGVPGLVCYLALLFVCAHLAWTACAEGHGNLRTLSLGLGGNLVALQIFGLTDAVALGAKLGLFFWLSIGLLVATHRIVRNQRADPGVVTPEIHQSPP